MQKRILRSQYIKDSLKYYLRPEKLLEFLLKSVSGRLRTDDLAVSSSCKNSQTRRWANRHWTKVGGRNDPIKQARTLTRQSLPLDSPPSPPHPGNIGKNESARWLCVITSLWTDRQQSFPGFMTMRPSSSPSLAPPLPLLHCEPHP